MSYTANLAQLQNLMMPLHPDCSLRILGTSVYTYETEQSPHLFDFKPHLDDLFSADMPKPSKDVHDPVGMGLPLQQGQEVHWKTTGMSNTRKNGKRLIFRLQPVSRKTAV